MCDERLTYILNMNNVLEMSYSILMVLFMNVVLFLSFSSFPFPIFLLMTHQTDIKLLMLLVHTFSITVTSLVDV